jgi:hypothetical protein
MYSFLHGKNVFIRTVTNYYTGTLVTSDDHLLRLDDAAWIADTGRFAEALETGQFSEIEPYPGTCYVAVGAIVDLSEWPHQLPRETR